MAKLDSCISLAEKELENVERKNYIRMPQKYDSSHVNALQSQATTKDIEINVDDDDDGYKSEALETSEAVSFKKPLSKTQPSSQSETSISNKISPIKSSTKPRPSSASRVPNPSREPSPFHARCKPVEPNRRFIALPLPSNLYQSDTLETFSKNIHRYFYSLNDIINLCKLGHLFYCIKHMY